MTKRHSPVRRRNRLFTLEALESRTLMSVDLHAGLAIEPALPAIAGPLQAPAIQAAAVYSLNSVPVLHSNPTATAKLYLDFDGAAAQTWGAYSVPATPAYDQDGDATTFSAGELASMQTIWSRVSESYSPFQIDVTTQDPGNLTDLKTLQVVLGGDGAWLGSGGGGVAYVDSFSNSMPNTVWIFTKNLATGNPKYSADAAAHEAGHGFGLLHQSTYDATGTKTAEYSQGNSLQAPIMGTAYYSTRGLWTYGTSSTGPTSYQDDLAVLTDGHNGFGYRADDHGDTLDTGDPLTVSGNSVTQSGVISRTTDKDVFSFVTDAGAISLSGNVATAGAMLDLKLSLYNSSGTLIASADTTSLGEKITATVPAGNYRLVVASHGGYGDLGQYTVSGTVLTPANFLAAPGSLAATAVSASQVNLTWQDTTSTEGGFKIERSSDGGATWATLSSVGANVTTASDTTGTAGSTYAYRVYAFTSISVSAYSNIVSAVTTPAAPASASAAAASTSQIDISWSNVSGETSFKIERSADGVSGWAQVGTTAADVTTYRDGGLAAGTKYYYRVLAANAAGTSAPSPVASATTQVSSLPAAPTNLAVSLAAKTSLTLTWTDNANNETGFRIERSANGTKWSEIAVVGANVTSYVNSGLNANTVYYYRVRAYNASGTSAYSNVLSTKTTPAAKVVGTASNSSVAPAKTSASNSAALVLSVANGGCDPRAVDRIDLSALAKSLGQVVDSEDALAADVFSLSDFVARRR